MEPVSRTVPARIWVLGSIAVLFSIASAFSFFASMAQGMAAGDWIGCRDAKRISPLHSIKLRTGCVHVCSASSPQLLSIRLRYPFTPMRPACRDSLRVSFWPQSCLCFSSRCLQRTPPTMPHRRDNSITIGSSPCAPSHRRLPPTTSARSRSC